MKNFSYPFQKKRKKIQMFKKYWKTIKNLLTSQQLVNLETSTSSEEVSFWHSRSSPCMAVCFNFNSLFSVFRDLWMACKDFNSLDTPSWVSLKDLSCSYSGFCFDHISLDRQLKEKDKYVTWKKGRHMLLLLLLF